MYCKQNESLIYCYQAVLFGFPPKGFLKHTTSANGFVLDGQLLVAIGKPG